MDTFIQLVTPWMNDITSAIIAFASIVAFAVVPVVLFSLIVLVWYLYSAVIAGLKCLYSYFKRKEIVNKDACEKFREVQHQLAEAAEEIAEDARVNVLNRDDSVQYATLGDIPEKEQIHHRIVRVGGDHPVDYIYNSETKEWSPLFGDITLGHGAPTLMLKDIHDLNIKTRIPGQKICIPEVYRMYEIGANGEVIPLPDEDVTQSTLKEVTSDGESN